MSKKRFWVFSGMVYYPAGGMSDFIASYDTKEEALSDANYVNGQDKKSYEWSHIYDSESDTIDYGAYN